MCDRLYLLIMIRYNFVIAHIFRRAQVVGWPPVRSCRRNIMAVQKNNKDDHDQADQKATSAANFVKVSMDGAPYLRKVDLKLYKSYQQLFDALRKMFRSFTVSKSYICVSVKTILYSKMIFLM